MIRKAKRRGERGQTIILVAISIVSLLGMAALAIDVVTLYVASSEIRRAADAAALAAAKAIADSGVTTLQQTDSRFPAAQALAQNMANSAVTALLTATPPVNPVAGANPMQMAGSPNFDWSRQGNPIIKVSLQRTGLPTFFAKIWGRTGSTVSASSTAEVYNPSNNPSYTPIAPSSVKPWLVANADPYNGGSPFILAGNLVETDGAVGETFNLTADCQLLPGCTPLFGHPPLPFAGLTGSYYWVFYAPAIVTSNAGNNVCPSSCLGSTYFEQSIECADVATTYSCGSGGASFGSAIYPGGVPGPSADGAECLIHAGSTGPLQGQDQLNNPIPFPNGPPQITGGTYLGNPYSGSLVSTSSSVVTIPIIDTPGFPTVVNVVGFMQAFINQVQPGTGPGTGGDINITVLNIAGCAGASNGNTPVVGGTGTSPVPVRLIASP